MEKWVEGKSNMAFLNFLPNFWYILYLMIFQRGACRKWWGTLKNHQILQKLGKKWRKAIFELPSTHLNHGIAGTRKSDFRCTLYPFRPYLVIGQTRSISFISTILQDLCQFGVRNGFKGHRCWPENLKRSSNISSR